MSNTNNTFKHYKVGDSTDFNSALKELDQKLSNVKKNISYLDVYNIVDACEDQQKFAAQTNALLPNSSLVINCDGFYFNNERYETGDIILKLANNQIIHIKAQTGGIFYPSDISVDGGNLKITYSFSAVPPEDEESEKEDNQESPLALAKTMIFPNLSIEQKSNIYGLWQPVTEPFAACYYNNQLIEPYIKFYLVKENIVEEICLDYSFSIIHYLFEEVEVEETPTISFEDENELQNAPNLPINTIFYFAEDTSKAYKIWSSGDYYKVGIDPNLQTSTIYMKVK